MPLVREPPSAVEGVCGLGFHSEPQNNFFGTTKRGGGDEWEQDEERLTQAFAAGSAGHNVLRAIQESDRGLGCQRDFTLNAST